MNYIIYLAVLAGIIFLFYRYATRDSRVKAAALAADFPEEWRQILATRVAFYLSLTVDEKKRFEREVQVFLAQTRITGLQTEVDDVTRVLVAASAIIPIFGFRDWEYGNLGEVLIVPDAWREARDPNRELAPLQGQLLGSVRNFQNQHYMHLSKASLEKGFQDGMDKQNVGIHEFAHMLDEADGVIDGVPKLALPPELLKPWAEVMEREIAAIREGKSEINSYGGTNEAEFFAVVTEYFFEKPEKLQENHPELYQLLSRALRQNPKKRFLRFSVDPREWLKTLRSKRKFGRNDPCPCGSGKKYKDCHLLQQEAQAA
ncbi:M90 family metallopeptidase [Hymenobacter cellulosivorans]|uniref:Zinc-dependent peptidase n=1 Tax=Hymenobacter cellulosivorans TaxID=2932249 RepID=A0ABY4F5R0_9BACT|nr:M90 family metallopeptidase [Hymenobacter cellulosivorans]UOQ52000.1 zinc-dependent peptidase [Hymenobacter cellulosivorans]